MELSQLCRQDGRGISPHPRGDALKRGHLWESCIFFHKLKLFDCLLSCLVEVSNLIEGALMDKFISLDFSVSFLVLFLHKN